MLFNFTLLLTTIIFLNIIKLYTTILPSSFVHDTCTAFQDFERDPQNSSLSSIVPCLDSSSSDELLIEIGSTIYKFITKVLN